MIANDELACTKTLVTYVFNTWRLSFDFLPFSVPRMVCICLVFFRFLNFAAATTEVTDVLVDGQDAVARQPSIERCEARVLMSAAPLAVAVDGLPQPADGIPHATAPLSQTIHLDADRESGGVYIAAAPASSSQNTMPQLAEGASAWIIDGEDNNARTVDLKSYFADAEQSAEQLAFSLVSVSEDSLFSEVALSADGKLRLNYAPDANGESTVLVRVSDGAGAAIEQEFRVSVLASNDRPTTSGLSDLVVQSGAGKTTIRLFDVFDDKEDADSELHFEVTGNTNPGLFASIKIDAETGILTLEHAEGVTGASDITLRATDSGGRYVETSSDAAAFPVYDHLLNKDDHLTKDVAPLGLTSSRFYTSYAFFELVDGKYDYDNLDEERLRTLLRDRSVFIPDRPVFLDIEQEHYSNTPEGRLLFARVLEIVHEERPDLAEVGFYSIFPKNNYFDPVLYWRSSLEVSYGPDAYHENGVVKYKAAYEKWLADNAAARDEPLGGSYGEKTLADLLTLINPSLYTWYRGGYNGSSTGPQEVVFQADGNRLVGVDFSVVDDMRVGFHQIAESAPPSAVKFATTFDGGASYYVVNSGSKGFQVATEKGGEPLDFGLTEDSKQRIVFRDAQAVKSVDHDIIVDEWIAYATANVAESKKFGDTVIAHISPSYRGVGVDYLDKNFFRLQLETLYEKVDGIAVFDLHSSRSENAGWWEALSEFKASLDRPTQFTVTVRNHVAAAANPPKVTVFATQGEAAHSPAGVTQSAVSTPAPTDHRNAMETNSQLVWQHVSGEASATGSADNEDTADDEASSFVDENGWDAPDFGFEKNVN